MGDGRAGQWDDAQSALGHFAVHGGLVDEGDAQIASDEYLDDVEAFHHAGVGEGGGGEVVLGERMGEHVAAAAALFAQDKPLAQQILHRCGLRGESVVGGADAHEPLGAERIARKLDLPVIFLDVQKVKRGYYTVEMKLMTAHAKQTAENEITESYARMTEKMILRNPAYWLWTHKRWKYKRE